MAETIPRSITALDALLVANWVALGQCPNLPSEPYDYVVYAVTNLAEHYKNSTPYGDAELTGRHSIYLTNTKFDFSEQFLAASIPFSS